MSPTIRRKSHEAHPSGTIEVHHKWSYSQSNLRRCQTVNEVLQDWPARRARAYICHTCRAASEILSVHVSCGTCRNVAHIAHMKRVHSCPRAFAKATLFIAQIVISLARLQPATRIILLGCRTRQWAGWSVAPYGDETWQWRKKHSGELKRAVITKYGYKLFSRFEIFRLIYLAGKSAQVSLKRARVKLGRSLLYLDIYVTIVYNLD